MGQNILFQYNTILIKDYTNRFKDKLEYTLIKTIRFVEIIETILLDSYMVEEYVRYSWPIIHTLKLCFSMYKKGLTL